MVEVHRCRFLELTPQGVESLSFNRSGSLLAVGRKGGSIDVYNASSWLCDRTIPGSGTPGAPEDAGGESRALAWGQDDRLFSSGTSGEITEWSASSLSSVRASGSYGGAVFGLAAASTGRTLAAACDDGTVKLFGLYSNSGESFGAEDLSLVKTLNRKAGRLLCVAWGVEDRMVVAAGVGGSVCGWDLERDTVVFTLNFGTPTTVVWAVACLQDDTVVTADSTGKTQFWDSGTGTLRYGFKEHQADVLCLAKSESGDCVWSCGVDNKLVLFQRSEDGETWTSRGGKRRHTHDVRALAAFKGLLVSAGDDTKINVFNKGDMIQTLSQFPGPNPLVSLGAEAGLLLARFPKSVELWKLGKAANPGQLELESSAEVLPMSQGALHLMDFEVSKARSALTCADLDRRGELLALSDSSDPLRLYSVQLRDQGELSKASLVRLSVPAELGHASRVLFTPDSQYLVAVTPTDRAVHVCSVDPSEGATLVASLDEHSSRPDPVALVACSPDSRYLATCDTASRVEVFSIQPGVPKMVCTIPKYEGGPFVAMAFSVNPARLVLVTSDSRVYVWEVSKSPTLTRLSKSVHERGLGMLPSAPGEMPAGVLVNPDYPEVAYVWSASWICRIPLSGAETLVKSLEQQHKANFAADEPGPVSVLRRYQYIAFVGILTDGSMAVVERPWLHVLRRLPEPFNYSRFGT